MKKVYRNIEVLVEPFSTSGNFYIVYWRPKRKINWFNYWRRIYKVWVTNATSYNYSHPLLFGSFNGAVEYAKELKSDPTILNRHYEEQDKKWDECVEREKKYYEERNKSFKL